MTERQRAVAVQRWQLLRPVVEDGVPLTTAAREQQVPVRIAQRWLARYRAHGLAGLARTGRADSGSRRLHPELVRLIEGLTLPHPTPSAATISRQVARVAAEQNWAVPAYSTVAGIVAALDPQLLTLAHQGSVALRDRYELVYRRQADRPNALWQADHTQLDLLILDTAGRPQWSWLTVVLDDASRAVAGYTVFLGAPSALNLSLALRQAIWRKIDPDWAVHGLPDVLYTDHGSDFTSNHLGQVTADLHIQLVHSAVGRPPGRGKVERFFGTVTSQLLPDLPSHLVHGKPVTPPLLSLPQLDAARRCRVRRNLDSLGAPQTAPNTFRVAASA